MVDLKDIKIVRASRKSIAMRLLPDGTIEVKAPRFLPSFLINDFIKKNTDWIEKKTKNFHPIKKTANRYVDGEEFYYLGVKHKFKIVDTTDIKVKDNEIHFPKALLFRAKKEMENWYIRTAKELIKAQVVHYAKEMNTTYGGISFSDTKSKWGSCSHDNMLQFNWRLIMAPIIVVRYVVIHELAHTIEKNHSHSFWSRVRAQNPSYKEQIKWLKIHGHELIV